MIKRSIYKNPGNDHTFRVEIRDPWSVLVERDWLGDEFSTLAKYRDQDAAQAALDKLADAMEWKYCGVQGKDHERVDG